MTEPVPTRAHALPEEPSGGSGGESAGTVVVAGLANLGIAVAKLVGGLISHSSAMLSEAAHSLADTITEVLLFVALKRGTRAPDARHPVGYGRETYFWALLACLATFTLGAGFSVYQGVTTIVEGEEQGDPRVAYVVLAVSFVLEGTSLLKAVLTLEQLTGSATWDGVAALAIGVLLLLVAGSLARANVSLLIGQSLPRGLEDGLRAEVAGLPQVVDVPVLLTSVIGPGQVIVSAKVDFADDVTVADIERASDEAERRLVARYPGVRYVFLDPTPGDGRARAEAHRPE
jgi:divalent metal cation (Fe/Co/Zn/Cd) transporter